MVSIHRPLGYEPSALPLRHFAVLTILQGVQQYTLWAKANLGLFHLINHQIIYFFAISQ